jgi:hypothetical protein
VLLLLRGQLERRKQGNLRKRKGKENANKGENVIANEIVFDLTSTLLPRR